MNVVLQYLNKNVKDQFSVYRLLNKHTKLASKRSEDYKNKRFIRTISILFKVVISSLLALLGITVAQIQLNNIPTALALSLYSLMPFIFLSVLTSKFAQKTDLYSNNITPYLLLPIKKTRLINAQLLASITTFRNIHWYTFIISFIITSLLKNRFITFIDGLLFISSVILGFQIICLFHQLIHKLFFKSHFQTFISILIYLFILSIPLLKISAINVFYLIDNPIGTFLFEYNLWFLILEITIIYILYLYNKRLSLKEINDDLNDKISSQTLLFSYSSYTNKQNTLISLLLLEWKAITRNKQIKKRFNIACLYTLFYCIIYAYSNDVNSFFNSPLVFVGGLSMGSSLLLSKIMMIEGNYIHLLMSAPKMIYKLLCAKYIFHVGLLFIPIFLTLPSIFFNTSKVYYILSYGLFISGFQYFLLFQLAVYNNECLPLEHSISGNKSSYNSSQHIIMNIILFIIPCSFTAILDLFMPIKYSLLFLSFIGLSFMICHKWWIRNIYERIITKRHQLIEGFINS